MLYFQKRTGLGGGGMNPPCVFFFFCLCESERQPVSAAQMAPESEQKKLRLRRPNSVKHWGIHRNSQAKNKQQCQGGHTKSEARLFRKHASKKCALSTCTPASTTSLNSGHRSASCPPMSTAYRQEVMQQKKNTWINISQFSSPKLLLKRCLCSSFIKTPLFLPLPSPPPQPPTSYLLPPSSSSSSSPRLHPSL